MKKVGIVMGSDSDLPVVEKAIGKLKEYGVPYEVHVYSAHRTPVQAAEFSRTAQEKGFGAIIAAAGKAAHLAGALAANTTLPVIGIPVKSSTLDGLDALLSTVQMPTASPWPRSPSTGQPTRPCWPFRSWPSLTRACPPSSRLPARPRPIKSWRRTPGSKQNTISKPLGQ